MPTAEDSAPAGFERSPAPVPKGQSMKMNPLTSSLRRRAALALSVGALTLAVTACGDAGQGEAAGDGSYKIGVLVGLTGSYAALGEPERQAIELYFDQVNKKGGIDGRKVELVVLDSGSDEGTAVNQYRKLAVEENVHAILGPSSSGESIALRTFSQSLKVPTIALASSSSIVEPAEESAYMFKQYTGTQESLRAQLQFAESQGWKKVALLHTNDGYGQDPAKQIKDAAAGTGVEITGIEAFDATATDVTAQLGRLGESKPDAVFVWAVNPANAVVAKSAESIKFKPVLFHSPGAGSQAYIENAGSAAEGTYLQGSVVLAADSLAEDNPQHKVTHALVDNFSKAYNDTAGQYAANGWDGAILLQNAIENAGEHDASDAQGTRDAIRDALENKTSEVVGVNAIYTYTPEYHGSVELQGLAVLGVTKGAFEVVKTY